MAISAANEKITLNFSWKGPTIVNEGCLKKGELEVKVVDLTFRSVPTTVRLLIPKNTSLGQETHLGSLRVKVEHIRSLVVEAGFFKFSPLLSKAIASEIKLEVPEDLETGQTYTLMITFDDKLSLNAHLIKENNEQIIEDRGTLLMFLRSNLLPNMVCKMEEFESHLERVSPDQKKRVLGSAELSKAICNIEKGALRKLVINLNQQSTPREESLNVCLNVIGLENLAGSMRSSLQGLVNNTIPFIDGPGKDEIPPERSLCIEEVVEKFKKLFT